VGIDQRLRVDFEPAVGVGGDIGGRARFLDQPAKTQQDAATFLGRGASGLGHEAIEDRS
jgi:hypothetical protein